MQNSPPSSSTTTVYTILTITTLLFLLLFFSSLPTTPPPPSFSDPYLFPHRPSTAQYHNHQLLFTTTNKTTNQSPPSIAYFISGSSNDSGRIIRLLFSIYHPRNQYLLHLDSYAPQKERDFLALTVQSVKVMWSAQNVNVIGKSDLVSPKGSSSVSSTLHGAAILLKLCSDWDWFINLSAADYPLVTQDDLLHILSYLPKDLNFVNHTSYIGWKESRILKPVVVDQSLFLAEQSEIFYGTQKRPLPDAYRLFTGKFSVLPI
ncbi:putative glycosyl transferase, family 14 [Helianthus annuus]|nr:putative glycosyl transferase, family 14 [Helianthus annuus]